MPEQTMTILEFAEKHCAQYEAGEDQRIQIQSHVDTIMLGALALDRVLWKVGIDADGRASLIWQSMPEDVWDQLLRESIKIAALSTLLRGVL